MSEHGGPSISRPGWRGRARESRLVGELLDAADLGRGGVILVEGPPGGGRSRLLSEAREAAARRGVPTGHGAADELTRLMPLAPLMKALGESVQALGLPRGTPAEGGDLRLWLVDRLRARLEARLATGSLLLTLDDLQWADPTTLLAIRSLVPELASYPLMWTLARTTTDTDSGVARLFDALRGDGARQVTVEPLDDDAVIEIAVDVLGAVPDTDLLTLLGEAGGSPSPLVALLEGLRDEGAVEVAGGRARLLRPGTPLLPQRLRVLAQSHLAGLAPRTRNALQVAAVLGRSFAPDELAEMLDEPADRFSSMIQEAVAGQILVPADDGLAFRHDLMWRLLNTGLSAPVRGWLHRRAGEMLLRRRDSAVPAATHFMDHARPGDVLALTALDRAAREVLPSAPQTAAELALRALELTGASDGARVGRTTAAVGALTAAGRLAEAASLAHDVLRQTPPDQAADLRHRLAIVLVMSGRPEDAIAEVERVLAAPDLPDELHDAAELTWFSALILQKDYERGRRRAETIVATRGRHGEGALVGALILLLHVAWLEGRIADGLDHVREAVRVAGHRRLGGHATTPHLFLAACLQSMRRFDEAEEVIRAAEEEIEATGHSVQAANITFVRAYMRLSAGRLDDAAAEAEAGLRTADELGTRQFARLGDAVLAIVALLRGDVAAAVWHCERYQAQEDDDAVPWGWGTWATAVVAEATGGPARARDVLDADPRLWPWRLALEPNLAAWWTRVSLATGDRGHAERVVATIERLAGDNPRFSALANAAAHACGILRGDAASLRAAVARFDAPWARASAAEDLGVLCADGSGGGGRDAAIRHLDEALEGYEKIGAQRDAARVRARLRRLGVRRRHWRRSAGPVTGWASLTDTERNVAELVAQGLTNRQVAAQMFVSPHTVKVHLAQVFRKLDIGSRVELAGVAVASRSTTESPGTPRTRGA